MRQVTITPVLNGFLVQVGCQQVVFGSIEELCSELKRYQKAPAAVEKEYLTNAVNKGPTPELAVPDPGDMRAERAGRALNRPERATPPGAYQEPTMERPR
jgi:hypothetical protein